MNCLKVALLIMKLHLLKGLCNSISAGFIQNFDWSSSEIKISEEAKALKCKFFEINKLISKELYYVPWYFIATV